MNSTINMAIATSVENIPNVRVVTFGYDEDDFCKLFFTSFKENKKVEEFKNNPNVACILLPEDMENDTQIRIFGKVSESKITLNEVAELIGRKTPENAETIKNGGEMMIVYEVSISHASITQGMNEPQILNF